MGLERYRAEQEKRKEARERAKVEFYRFADREKRKRNKDGLLKNKSICFSHPLELELPLSKKLLAAAFSQGAFFTSHAEECDMYVCFAGEGGQRLKSVKGRVLTTDEFSAYMGCAFKPVEGGQVRVEDSFALDWRACFMGRKRLLYRRRKGGKIPLSRGRCLLLARAVGNVRRALTRRARRGTDFGPLLRTRRKRYAACL